MKWTGQMVYGDWANGCRFGEQAVGPLCPKVHGNSININLLIGFLLFIRCTSSPPPKTLLPNRPMFFRVLCDAQSLCQSKSSLYPKNRLAWDWAINTPYENIYQFDTILHSILMSFGFVLMRCPIHCRERAEEMVVDSASLRIPIHVLQFVHLSGGMFVKYDINQYYWFPLHRLSQLNFRSSFMWAWNHMLSQKYRTS